MHIRERVAAMPDNIIIRCLNCGTKNRIPNQKFHGRPTCGHCHAPLDDLIIRCLKCGTKNRMPEERLDSRPLCGKCKEPLIIARQVVKPIDITDDSFAREVLTAEMSVMVDCWAPWCGPCKMLAPIIEELASDYANGVKVAKLSAISCRHHLPKSSSSTLNMKKSRISALLSRITFADSPTCGELVEPFLNCSVFIPAISKIGM